jgi:hypothetical protein
MNKILPAVLILLFMSIIPVAAAGSSSSTAVEAEEETERASETLSSSSILVKVDYETGRIFLSTTEGREEIQGDEKRGLLFYDQPPSSYTVVYANGDVFVFGGDMGKFIKRPVREGTRIESVWENDLVQVRQDIELVRRKGSGREDGVLITYTVKNRRTVVTDIGLQILFDTYLGENDTFHFELPQEQGVRYETVYEGSELPKYWLSHEGEGGPMCLRGVVGGELATLPDKLIFANYRALRKELFDYKVRRKKSFDLLPYSRNDSAVAILFKPDALEPDKTKEFRAIIGLCGLEEYVRGKVLVEEPEAVEPSAPEEGTPVPLILQPDIDLEQLSKILLSIDISRESLQRINSYIAELNSALDKRDSKVLSNEEIERLQRLLEEVLAQ